MKRTILCLLISYCCINSQLLATSSISKGAIISPPKVEKAIKQLHKKLLKDLQNNQQDCEVLRQKMDVLIAALGYDRIFIVGKKDKYYREGMHQEFEEAPRPLQIKIQRKPMAEQLELAHVDLYYCDKNLYSRITRFTNFIANNTPEKVGNLLTTLQERLYQLPIKEQKRLKRNKPQQIWLKNQLADILELDMPIEERDLLSQSLAIIKEKTGKEDTPLTTIATNKVITKENTNHQILIFPNPNRGNFQLRTTFEWSEKATVEIIDITGRIILSKKLVHSSSERQIQLPAVDKGVYFLRLIDPQEQWQKMFIIE